MALKLRDVFPFLKKDRCRRCGERHSANVRCGWREFEQATAAPGEKRDLG